MFLDGILHQRGAFAQLMGVRDEDVHVRLFLDDGDSVTLRDFQTIGPFSGTDWGMIVARDVKEGLVIRESSVIRAKFQLAAEPPEPIGFKVESTGA